MILGQTAHAVIVFQHCLTLHNLMPTMLFCEVLQQYA